MAANESKNGSSGMDLVAYEAWKRSIGRVGEISEGSSIVLGDLSPDPDSLDYVPKWRPRRNARKVVLPRPTGLENLSDEKLGTLLDEAVDRESVTGYHGGRRIGDIRTEIARRGS